MLPFLLCSVRVGGPEKANPYEHGSRRALPLTHG